MKIREVRYDEVVDSNRTLKLAFWAFMGAIAAILLVIFLSKSSKPAEATSCKSLNANCFNSSDHSCCSGLSCQNGQGGYKCRSSVTPTPTQHPTATPTVAPTSTPEPTIVPCDGCCEKDCEVTPTEEPVVTPVDTHGSNVGDSALTNNTTDKPVCGDLSVAEMPQDLWYTNYQLANGTASLVLHWGTNPNYGAVHIVYGERIGQWNYAALNVPNNGQFTIGGLKPHQTYWFQVAYVRGCSVGQYSHPVDP